MQLHTHEKTAQNSTENGWLKTACKNAQLKIVELKIALKNVQPENCMTTFKHVPMSKNAKMGGLKIAS